MPLAPLPERVLELLRAPEPTSATTPLTGEIPQGQRNDVLYRTARSLVTKGLTAGAIHLAVAEENRTRCRPPLPDREVRELVEHALVQPNRADFVPAPNIPPAEALELPSWPLYDAADIWTFAPVAFAVDELLPLLGVVWWGGMPKRFKSLLMLYVCLAIACGRETIAGHFAIRQRPR